MICDNTAMGDDVHMMSLQLCSIVCSMKHLITLISQDADNQQLHGELVAESH